jgi:hypothetical protein
MPFTFGHLPYYTTTPLIFLCCPTPISTAVIILIQLLSSQETISTIDTPKHVIPNRWRLQRYSIVPARLLLDLISLTIAESLAGSRARCVPVVRLEYHYIEGEQDLDNECQYTVGVVHSLAFIFQMRFLLLFHFCSSKRLTPTCSTLL